MEFSNAGESVYHSIVSVYAQSDEGKLLAEKNIDPVTTEDDDLQPIRIAASRENDDGQKLWTGLTLSGLPAQDGNSFSFSWFINLVSRNTRLESAALPVVSDGEEMAEKITKIFEEDLLSKGHEDQWDATGRQVFKDKVQYLTKREAKIEFCLPAFPCKSTNGDKVSGVLPDKGEEIALKNIHSFVGRIEDEYKPGGKVWIVSDGHVFSDCIGVDDLVVDKYNDHLIEMNKLIADGKGEDRIGFLSLTDLFFSEADNDHVAKLKDSEWPQIYHPVGTSLDQKAELCRKILISGCGIDPLALKEKINKQDPSLLALYRGFSKFMLEDLAKLKSLEGLSRTRCKNLASKVAFEMIQRNQAYSNLIELLFPLHLRLSIHAHNNKGPKFGVNLLPLDLCKAGSLEGRLAPGNSEDLLHIPTPWHNTVFEVDGDEHYYVAKSKVVREAIDNGECEGEWVPGSGATGGRFLLEV